MREAENVNIVNAIISETVQFLHVLYSFLLARSVRLSS